MALAAGFLTSYVVELLQFYIPTRSSAWDDVTPNSMGAVAGFSIFELCGAAILRKLSQYEETFDGWLSLRRTAVLLLVYFGLWAGISIPLQQQTRLSNWDPQCVLFVGNDASGHRAWKGQVSQLQFWNRALPENLIDRIAAGDPTQDTESGLLASYDFTGPAPYLNQMKFLPALTWMPATPVREGTRALEMDGSSWLTSTIPVAEMTREIQETNQFTVHLVCTPAETLAADERIVSISQSADNVNVHLRQEGTTLVLWFRNPLSETRSVLAWYVPGIFAAGQQRDIVASYDGSDAFIYVNGKAVATTYRLGPGASLKHTFSTIQTTGLEGHVVIYQTLVFLPMGLFIGMAARKWSAWKTPGKLLLAAGLLLPPVLLEVLLVWVSGRRIWAGNIFLSLLLSIVGVRMVNADRRVKDPAHIS